MSLSRPPSTLRRSLLLIITGAAGCSDEPISQGATDGATDSTSMTAETLDPSSSATSTAIDTTTTDGSDDSTTGPGDSGEPVGEPACPPAMISESCDRQFILRAPMVAGDGNDLFVGNSESILRIDRTTGFAEVFSSAGDPSNLHAIVGEGDTLRFIRDLDVVPGGPLFVLQDSALHVVDRETGERTWVPEPAFNSIRSIAWDASEGRLLVAEFDNSTDETSISIFDPATAERTLLASADDSGPALTHPAAMAVDPDSGTIYVLNQVDFPVATPKDVTFIVAVDPTTGTRTLVSGNGAGNGPALELARSLAFSSEGSLFVANFGSFSVLQVDVSSGDRVDVTSRESWSLEPLDVAVVDGQLLVSDLTSNAIHEIDRSSGEHRLRMTSTVGTGPRIRRPRDVTTDGERLYVLPRLDQSILVVDPVTGERTRIAEGVPFSGAESIRFAPGLDRLYVTDRVERALLSVDIESGAYTVVSDAEDGLGDGGERGSGPAFGSPTDFALDLDNDRAFVLDSSARAVIEVDLETGDRSVFSDDANENTGGAAVGEGPAWTEPAAIVLDQDNQRLLVQDVLLETVFAVSLVPTAMGDRSVFSGGDPRAPVGSGPRLAAVRFALDTNAGRLFAATGITADGAGVFELDLETGDRSVVSSSFLSVGSGWETAALLGLVSVGGVLYAVDDADHVMRIEEEGDRWVVAAGGTEPTR